MSGSNPSCRITEDGNKQEQGFFEEWIKGGKYREQDPLSPLSSTRRDDPPSVDCEQPSKKTDFENELLLQRIASSKQAKENEILKQQMIELKNHVQSIERARSSSTSPSKVDGGTSLTHHVSKNLYTCEDLGLNTLNRINSYEFESPTAASSTPQGSITTEEFSDGTSLKTHGCYAGEKWKEIVHKIRDAINFAMNFIASAAVKFPLLFIVAVTVFSMGILVTGFFTNFQLEVSEDVAWTPVNSPTFRHSKWITTESNFPLSRRYTALLFHANGDDVLEYAGKDGIEQAFLGLDAMRNGTGYYDSVCNATTSIECDSWGITKFWKDDINIFTESNYDSHNEDSLHALKLKISSKVFPDGTPVFDRSVFGLSERDGNTNMISEAKAYFVALLYPDTEEGEEFEAKALESIFALQKLWGDQKYRNRLQMEVITERSFGDEFMRAIFKDLPLIPVVFFIMSMFTCLVFMKRHPVQSKSLLGIGSVVSVLFSLMTGYGLLFLIGIPFTSMCQILPFIIFGVGLDNSFIIIGSYNRTDCSQSIEKRVKDTINDIGNSIFLTTSTSAIAFALGATSSVPSVRSLCLYAFANIIFVLLYQLTFFIALIVMDSRRIKNNKKDLFCCIEYKEDGNEKECRKTDEKGYLKTKNIHGESSEGGNVIDNFMRWYSKKLMRPWVKAIVLLLSVQLFAVCAYSATKLTQEFSFTDIMPKDSYVTKFYDATQSYTLSNGVVPRVVFRDVDQSNHTIQEQMLSYIDRLLELEHFNPSAPNECWLKDFNAYRAEELVSKLLSPASSQNSARTITFNEQLDDFLSIPEYDYLYGEDIVRDDVTGDILTSRCWLYMDNVDQEDVHESIGVLEDLQHITELQPINQNNEAGRWAFFTFDGSYSIWEFYAVAVKELTFTTIMGVSAVCAVALLLVPNWTALLFVLPLICILYVDLLGILQFAGVHINAVSYIALIMSIGLMVDFIMHILLRYYECRPGTSREARVEETLRTMGSSVLLGAISTLLGVIPLAFASSNVINIIFKAFIALVLLGVGHGLVVLPIVLSLFGPIF